jgi:P27 family predicted phage terminase small subunit
MVMPRKSIKELKDSGVYRPSVHGSEEDLVSLEVQAPDTPAFLNPEAMEYFQELVGYGLDMDVISSADGAIVALLASEFTEWVELDKIIKNEGFLKKMPTATGYMQEVVNPSLKIRDDKLKVILKMLSELGLTPVARSRLQVNKSSKEAKTPLGQFLENG